MSNKFDLTKMITLAKKIKEEKERKEKGIPATETAKGSRISIRDKLLTKGLTLISNGVKYFRFSVFSNPVMLGRSRHVNDKEFHILICKPYILFLEFLEVSELEENLPGEAFVRTLSHKLFL